MPAGWMDHCVARLGASDVHSAAGADINHDAAARDSCFASSSPARMPRMSPPRASRLQRATAPRGRGRRAVRRALARPLLAPTRRSTRSSRSASSCRGPTRTRSGALADRREERRAAAAARRGHVAVRPDRRRRARHRQQQAPEPACSSSMRDARTRWVEPGIVLDDLNAQLKPHGLWYPVDVSTSRAGHARRHGGNNSLRLALDPLRQHGAQRARDRRLAARRRDVTFGAVLDDPRAGSRAPRGHASSSRRVRALARARARRDRSALCRRCCAASAATTSTSASSERAQHGASCSVGSEGTLAYFAQAQAQALAAADAQGARRRALPDASIRRWTRRSTSSKLEPAAVELVDRTMIELARENPRVPRRPSSKFDARRARRDPARRVRGRRARRRKSRSCSGSSS